MLRLASGTVTAILSKNGVQTCTVSYQSGPKRTATAYPETLPRQLRVGDQVLLNTTAADLGLGTGGHDFVVALLEPEAYMHGGPEDGADPTELRQEGHVVKLRYTPLQRTVLCVEAPESPYHELMTEAVDAAGMVVVAAELHSQAVLLVRLLARLAEDDGHELAIAYIMPDGGALPASFSRQLVDLRRRGLVCGVITCGEAHGGDLEAVTVHSGLIAARHVLNAQVCVAGIGPGIVGTGTPFGTTALSQGASLNAALDVGARAVAAVRVSFADARPRHRGLSHHTTTVLERVVQRRVRVAVPLLQGGHRAELREQLAHTAIPHMHDVEYGACSITRATCEQQPRITTMGREYGEDPAFFDAVGAAALVTYRQLGSLR